MNRANRDELFDRLTRVEQMLDHVDRSIEKIEVATIVRDPSSKLSVDAYDGLRKQVVAAAASRVAHLAQLAQFAEAVPTATTEELLRLVEEWMVQASLVRYNDPHEERLYDVLGGEGDQLEVLRPAYIDATTGRPILMGQAERVQSKPEPVVIAAPAEPAPPQAEPVANAAEPESPAADGPAAAEPGSEYD